MTLQEIFIKNLKKHRKRQGMSQMALAELCEMGGNYIGQIEMGRRIPSFGKIEKIAQVLDIPSYELFMGENTEKEEDLRPETREYLQKMPLAVKKELSSRLISLMKNEIFASLDPKNY
jgi:transcriptional regulator with XRE-family HTH domain